MAVTAVIGDNSMSTEVEVPLLNSIVEGSVDSKGRPAVRSKTGGWRSSYFILGTNRESRSVLVH